MPTYIASEVSPVHARYICPLCTKPKAKKPTTHMHGVMGIDATKRESFHLTCGTHCLKQKGDTTLLITKATKRVAH